MHIALLSFHHTAGGGGGVGLGVALKVYPRIEYLTIVDGGKSGPVEGWLDITSRWRADEPIICEYGIAGSDPATDHVADAGTLSFTLDDGARSHTYGLTSPLSPTRLFGWNVGTPIRFSLGQSTGTRFYKFKGSLSEVTPDPGVSNKSERRSRCTAVDMWDDFAQTPLPSQPVLTGYRSDALIAQLLDALPFTVNARALDTGVETFPYAFDRGAGQGITIREAIQQVCLSEFGYAYRRGDFLNGDTFVFENRSHRVSNPPTLWTLTDADIVAMDATASRDDVYRTVRVTVHPMRVDQFPTFVTIYSLESTPTTIANGQTLTMIGVYRNQNSQEQLIAAIDQQPPEAFTDYTMNVAQDGSGADLTLGFSVQAFYAADHVKYVIHNASGSAAFITKLEARGRGLYRSDATVEGTVTTAQNFRTIDIDMPFQGSMNTAADVAAIVVNNYYKMLATVRSVTFVANRSQALLSMAMGAEPGDRIVLTEAVTGMSQAPFTINSVRYEVNGEGVLWCTWGLEPAAAQTFWQLDVGQLDSSTTLGF